MITSIFRKSKNWYINRATDYKNKDNRLFKWIDFNHDRISKCTNVYIYGSDAQSLKLYDYLVAKGFNNKLFFIENNPYKRKELNAISINEILANDNSFCVLIISPVNNEQIRQLVKRKIPKESILIYRDYIFRSLLFVSIKKAYKDFIQLIKALFLYARLKGQYQHKKIFVCPYPGTGDILFTGDIFNLILEKNKITNKEYIVLVGSNSSKAILKHFDIYNVDVLPQKEIDLCKIICSLFPSTQTDIVYLGFWGLNFQRIARLGYTYKLTFRDLLHGLFLGKLPEETQIKNFSFNSASTDFMNYFKHQIDFDKVIVISPTAGIEYDEGVPISFWEKITKYLSDKGYIVYTNTNGKDFPVLKNSNQLFLDYDNLFHLLNKCKALIGIRSGLFDIMHATNCKKIVFYPRRYSEMLFNFFSLNKNFNDTKNCIEIKLIDSEKRIIKVLQKEFDNE